MIKKFRIFEAYDWVKNNSYNDLTEEVQDLGDKIYRSLKKIIGKEHIIYLDYYVNYDPYNERSSEDGFERTYISLLFEYTLVDDSYNVLDFLEYYFKLSHEKVHEGWDYFKKLEIDKDFDYRKIIEIDADCYTFDYFVKNLEKEFEIWKDSNKFNL